MKIVNKIKVKYYLIAEGPRSKRIGNLIIASINSKTDFTVIPIKRNGNNKSHTKG